MLVIDEIKSDDLNELAKLFEELSGIKTNFELMRENFKLMQSNKDYILLGSKLNNILVGTLMGIVCKDIVGDCKPFMLIENVIVSEKYRGNGIGKKLMSEIEGIAKKRNCYYIIFVSGKQRKEAHNFYESIGYKLDMVQGFKKYL